MSRKSRRKRMDKLKANDEVPIEWFKDFNSKTSGTCARCRVKFPMGELINGHFRYPMHAACWAEHLKERRG